MQGVFEIIAYGEGKKMSNDIKKYIKYVKKLFQSIQKIKKNLYSY